MISTESAAAGRPGPMGHRAPRGSSVGFPVLAATSILLLFTAGCFALWSQIGFLAQLHDVFPSHPDSRAYFAISNYIWGESATVSALQIGIWPFGFPLFLGLSKTLGIGWFIGLQFLLNLASVVFVFLAIQCMNCRISLAVFGCGLLCSSMTFMFAPLFAITETLAVFFVSLFVYFLSRSCSSGKLRYRLYGVAALSCATCVKGIFLPFLVAYALAVGHGAFTRGVAGRTIAWFALAALPLAAQLAFSWSVTGKATISTAGSHNFSTRFFPAVYGTAHNGEFAHYKGEVAEQARAAVPDLPGQISFVLGHPIATGRVAASILAGNLFAGSPLVIFPADSIRNRELSELLHRISIRLNAGLASLDLVAALCLVLLLRTQARGDTTCFLVPAFLLLGSIIGLSVLTYSQGDRILLVGLPLRAAIYPTVLGGLLRVVLGSGR